MTLEAFKSCNWNREAEIQNSSGFSNVILIAFWVGREDATAELGSPLCDSELLWVWPFISTQCQGSQCRTKWRHLSLANVRGEEAPLERKLLLRVRKSLVKG